ELQALAARARARSRAPVAQGIEHRSPKAGVGSSNLPRRTDVFAGQGWIGASAAVGSVSDLSGTGQCVVGDLSQDVDGLSRTWTDAGGRDRLPRTDLVQIEPARQRVWGPGGDSASYGSTWSLARP